MDKTAEPTLTLLNLTTQLSSIQKILSTRLLDSRTHLKSLREIEQGINEKQIRLKELEKRHAKNESLAGEVEKLRYEIKESSYGLGEKRGDGFKKSEKAVWEAYTEVSMFLHPWI
jgi:DNA repair ATPase RecN